MACCSCEALSLVRSVRALKMHGGGPVVTAGKPLDHAYTNEDTALVKAGTCNLAKHVANTRKYGVPVIVAINKFASDTEAELAAVREAALEAGMTSLVHYAAHAAKLKQSKSTSLTCSGLCSCHPCLHKPLNTQD